MKFQNHYLKLVTEGRADGLAKSNMPLQLFQSWGHTKSYLKNSVDQVQMVSEN